MENLHDPICSSCQHRHQIGIKCPICGHVGRSQLYWKMKVKLNERMSLRHIYFSGENITDNIECWELCFNLRNQVYVNELGIISENEPNMVIERASFHFLGLYGDSPAISIRFQIKQYTFEYYSIEIDRLSILPRYRQKGLFNHILHILIQLCSKQFPIFKFESLIVHVPSFSSFIQYLLNKGYQSLIDPSMVDLGSVSYVPLKKNLS